MKTMTPREYFRVRKAQGNSHRFPKVTIRLDPALDQMIRERKEASLDTWIPTIIINHDADFRKEWFRRNANVKNDNDKTND